MGHHLAHYCGSRQMSLLRAKELQLMVSLAIAISLSFCAPVGSLELQNLSTAVSTSEDWAQAQHDLVIIAVHLGARLPKFVMASQSPHGGDAALLDLALRCEQTAQSSTVAVDQQYNWRPLQCLRTCQHPTWPGQTASNHCHWLTCHQSCT